MSWVELYCVVSIFATFFLFWEGFNSKTPGVDLRNIILIVLLQGIIGTLFSFTVVPAVMTTVSTGSNTYTIAENGNTGLVSNLVFFHTLIFWFTSIVLGLKLLRYMFPSELRLAGRR